MSRYNSFNPYSSQYGHSSGQMSGEDVREQLEHQMRSGVMNAGLRHEENGNVSFLGLEIPKELEQPAESLLGVAKTYAIDKSDAIFRAAYRLANRIPKLRNHSDKVGTIAENLVRWGVVSFEEIATVVEASSKSQHAKKEILQEFQPIIQATGINAKTNGVLREEYNRVDGEWWNDMKKLVADAPKLGLMIMFGLQKQYASNAQRPKWIEQIKNEDAALEKARANATKTPEELAAAHQGVEKERLEKFRQEQTIYTNRRDQFDEECANHVNEEIKKYKDFDSLQNDEKQKIRDRIETQFRDRFEEGFIHPESQSRHEEHDVKVPETNDRLLFWANMVAPIFTGIIKARMDKTAIQEKRESTYSMIKTLAEEIENQCGNPGGDCERGFSSRAPEEIYINGRQLTDYIMDIFQQYEKNNGYSGLGAALIAKLKPTANLIAEHLTGANGKQRLDAKALVNLVGDNSIIIHDKPKAGDRNFATLEDAEKAINALLPVMGIQEASKREDVLRDFENPKQAEELLKKNLNDGLKGDKRAFFASLFPAAVLREEGIKDADITAMQNAAHPHRHGAMGSMITYIASLPAEEKKQLGLSEQQVEMLGDLADKIKADDIGPVKEAIDNNKEIAVSVRVAALNMQLKNVGVKDAIWEKAVSTESKALQAKFDVYTPPKQEKQEENTHKDEGFDKDQRWADRDNIKRDKTMDNPSLADDGNFSFDNSKKDREFSSRFDKGEDSWRDLEKPSRRDPDSYRRSSRDSSPDFLATR